MERAGNQLLRFTDGIGGVFASATRGLAILPPFPMDATALDNGINDQPLRALLESRFTVGVALVRLGRYSIAVYEGQQLAVSKTDTRYVKSRHHAGGTSQQRFRRVRENQIHRLYVEASGVLERQWATVARPPGTTWRWAARPPPSTGSSKRCPMLARLSSITLPRRLDVREPQPRRAGSGRRDAVPVPRLPATVGRLTNSRQICRFPNAIISPMTTTAADEQPIPYR